MDLTKVALKKVDRSQVKDSSTPQPKKALEDLERNKKVQDTNVERWEEDLRPELIPALLIPLSRSHALSIHKGYEVRVLKKQNKQMSDEDLINYEELAHQIDEKAKGLKTPNKFFVRLNTRSPKDARVFSPKCREAIKSQIDEIEKSKNGPVSLNEHLGAVHRAVFRSLAVESGKEAVDLLISSRRIWQDIEASLEFVSNSADSSNLQIVLREWANLDTALEFRMFVYNRKLTAMCSYNRVCFWPEVFENKQKIQNILTDYWNNRLEKLISKHLNNFIIDVGLIKDEKGGYSPIVIELNPFNDFEGNRTDAELFDWQTDLGVLTGEKPFEFRVLSHPLEKDAILPKVPMAVRILMGWVEQSKWNPEVDHW